MGRLAKMRRDRVKAQFEKANTKGGEALVSAADTRKNADGMRQAAAQGVGALQQASARNTLKQTGGGSVATGGAVAGNQALAQAAGRTSVQATGVAQQQAAAERARLGAAALRGGAELEQENKQKLANIAKAPGRIVGEVAGIAKGVAEIGDTFNPEAGKARARAQNAGAAQGDRGFGSTPAPLAGVTPAAPPVAPLEEEDDWRNQRSGWGP